MKKKPISITENTLLEIVSKITKQVMEGEMSKTAQHMEDKLGTIEEEEELNELDNVVHKEGDKWKIRGHKGKGNNEADGDWAADYSSKSKADAALRAYFAQNEKKKQVKPMTESIKISRGDIKNIVESILTETLKKKLTS